MPHDPVASRWNVPELRVARCSEHAIRPEGEHVLYWMTAFRRVRRNFSLQRAVDWARSLNRPLLELDALRERLERFRSDVIEALGGA